MTKIESEARTALQEAVKRWGLPKIADEFNVNSKTLVRWGKGYAWNPVNFIGRTAPFNMGSR